jgi:ribosomal protein S2
MEKRRIRMGITYKFFNFNKKVFVNVQSNFSVKKIRLNSVLRRFILGFKFGFSINNSEYFIEQCKRVFLFCFSLTEARCSFLFIGLNSFFKDGINFFAYRSLEAIISVKWIHGLLTNSLWVKPSVLVLSQIQNSLFLKESFIRNLPFILIDNVNSTFSKYFYFIIGDRYSKKFLFLYYKNLSNFLILTKLYKCVK